MAAVTWLFAIEEPADDVLSIPSPPVPFHQPPTKGRVRWSRRMIHSVFLVGLCATLATVVLLLGRVIG